MQTLLPGGPAVDFILVPGDELRRNIEILERQIQALKSELEIRKGDGNHWRYGFLTPDRIWLGFDSREAALEGAKETWPNDPEGAIYRVCRIYV